MVYSSNKKIHSPRRNDASQIWIQFTSIETKYGEILDYSVNTATKIKVQIKS